MVPSRKHAHTPLVAGNVLLHFSSVNPHGFTVRIADFGLARRQGKEYPQDPDCGTCSHLCPQVIKGQPPTQVRFLDSIHLC